ncbi:MAG: 3'(2'),5'-bisphosphate nucleotidase [Rhodothermales bacterium]|nr:3'(2'),5'-bisphosphate nucleotidase [Rhodothermales bacterium]
MMYRKEVQAALEAVRAAARLTRAVRKSTKPGSLQKGDRSPVTVADFGSQALVCHTIREHMPGAPIIAEESASALREPENGELLERVTSFVQQVRPAADRQQVLDWIDLGTETRVLDEFWTLDPIDGTKGFLRGDQYAVALALVRDGWPVVAALACPALPHPRGGADGTILVAVAGEGCFEIAEDSGERSPVRVSSISDPADLRLSESVESGHTSHGQSARIVEALGTTASPRRLDSQAKYAVVARGEAEAYMRVPTTPGRRECIWDHAAGALVVAEAGGRITDLHGRDLDFSHGPRLTQNTGVLATNGHVHQVVLEALEREGVVG